MVSVDKIAQSLSTCGEYAAIAFDLHWICYGEVVAQIVLMSADRVSLCCYCLEIFSRNPPRSPFNKGGSCMVPFNKDRDCL